MTDPESFAVRWARLKRAAAKEQQEVASAQSAPDPADAVSASGPAVGAQAGSDRVECDPKAHFDPKTLPPIDSISAESDIKAFLQNGVPKDLTRAALRRAWTVDPAICNFIGLAENQWDFTDATAMPGFGPLEATDNVRQLVAQAMGRLIDSTKVQSPQEIASALEGARAPEESPGEIPTALQFDDKVEEDEAGLRQELGSEEHRHVAEVGDVQQSMPAKKPSELNYRRTHGSALPK